MCNIGVTRKLPENFFVSAGYIFSENSSPDPGFHPLIPDTDLHLMSVGFGRKGERWDWALSYTFAYNSGREVTGSVGDLTGVPNFADGTYEIHNHAINCRIFNLFDDATVMSMIMNILDAFVIQQHEREPPVAQLHGAPRDERDKMYFLVPLVLILYESNRRTRNQSHRKQLNQQQKPKLHNSTYLFHYRPLSSY